MMSSLSAPKAKANWTPAFHEIFVDSCLEQTLNGNKPGTHFTKEGWRNIVESFNKKTGLRYDKKQMKNHWDSTKEQWRVWCKLIKANGMKWDPVTCKFGANDEEWIKYAQENPEAAQFRFKELQHVNKLKTIFDGSVSADDTELPTLHRGQNNFSTISLLHAKESRTANPDEWVDCSSDAVVVYTRRGRRLASEQSTSVSKESKPKASWLPALHETFIDICLQETLKGNRPGTHFTKEGWRNIVESFQEKTGLRYERIQLKNHWDSTKEQWKVWCKLISTSHMKWDSNTRRFGASEEDWENYIKANSEAAQFRFKEIQSTDKLEIIFDGTTNTGDADTPSLRRGLNDGSTSSQEQVTTKLERKRRRLDDSAATSQLHLDEPGCAKLDRETEHLYDVESGSAVTIQRSSITFRPTKGIPNYSIGECIQCLDGMEEVEQGSSLYMFALDLFLKIEYREIFLELKEPSVRVAWLQRLHSFSPPLY